MNSNDKRAAVSAGSNRRSFPADRNRHHDTGRTWLAIFGVLFLIGMVRLFERRDRGRQSIPAGRSRQPVNDVSDPPAKNPVAMPSGVQDQSSPSSTGPGDTGAAGDTTPGRPGMGTGPAQLGLAGNLSDDQTRT